MKTCKEIRILIDEAGANLTDIDSLLNEYKIDGKESHLREIDEKLKLSEKLKNYFNSKEYRESVLNILKKWAKSVQIEIPNISISKEGKVVVTGDLNLHHLTSLNYFPQIVSSVKGYLGLRNLTTAKNLTLPQSVGGDIYLYRLTTAQKDELRKKYPHLKII